MQIPSEKNIPTVAIIGAGFSGISAAYNLSRLTDKPLKITLCDVDIKNSGLAYSTSNPSHLLNVIANKMSALEDDENHFVSWLINNPWTLKYAENIKDIPNQYMPRFVYRHYLQSLIDNIKTNSSSKVNIKLLNKEVIKIYTANNQKKIILKDNSSFYANIIILACGNFKSVDKYFFHSQYEYISNPWDFASLKKIPRNNAVLIIGTGLSMIDTVLSLQDQQHNGQIYAISRRGLVPQTHTNYSDIANFSFEELPTKLSALVQYLRKIIHNLKPDKDWRSVLDALRPHSQNIWKNLSNREKKRFLKYLMPYWETHRHRIPPQISKRINSLRNEKKLKITAGKIVQIGPNQIKIHTSCEAEPFEPNYIINCTGPGTSFINSKNPLLQFLANEGIIKPDSLGLGIAVSNNGAVIDQKDTISNWLFTLGPLCRGTFWECTSVPDIRKQSYNLAINILTNHLFR